MVVALAVVDEALWARMQPRPGPRQGPGRRPWERTWRRIAVGGGSPSAEEVAPAEAEAAQQLEGPGMDIDLEEARKDLVRCDGGVRRAAVAAGADEQHRPPARRPGAWGRPTWRPTGVVAGWIRALVVALDTIAFPVAALEEAIAALARATEDCVRARDVLRRHEAAPDVLADACVLLSNLCGGAWGSDGPVSPPKGGVPRAPGWIPAFPEDDGHQPGRGRSTPSPGRGGGGASTGGRHGGRRAARAHHWRGERGLGGKSDRDGLRGRRGPDGRGTPRLRPLSAGGRAEAASRREPRRGHASGSSSTCAGARAPR